MRLPIHSRLVLIVACAIFPLSSFSAPMWADEPASRVGSQITLVCTGEGPSADLARREALLRCKGSAADQVSTTLEVSTLVAESENSVGLHQEIRSIHKVTGLDCNPLRELTEPNGDSYITWLQCRFDLAKAKIERGKEEPVERKQVGEARLLSLVVIPKCESVIIKGARARRVSCDHNPVSLQIFPGDKKAIVRAKGFQPKHIELGDEGVLSVTLDRD